MTYIPNDTRTKYMQRELMKGGPFAIPDNIIQIDGKEILNTHKINIGNIEDISSYGNNQTKTPDEIAEEIINGDIKLPIIYKPNNGALSEGIFIINQKDEDIEIILPKPTDKISQRKSGSEFYLLSSGLKINMDEPNIYKFYISRNETYAKKLIKKLFEFALINPMPYYDPKKESQMVGLFDPGIIENYIRTWKYDGRSYETRYEIVGDLTTGEVDNTTEIYSRKGGSIYYSNIDPFSEGKLIETPNIEILTEIIPEGRTDEFRESIESKLINGFKHLSSQLNSHKTYLGPSKVQFDLMWIHNKNDIPEPFLTEYDIITIEN